MVSEDGLNQYDENSIFVCFYCKGNIKEYSILKKYDLEPANNDVVCPFCRAEVEEPFESILDAINVCKIKLKGLRLYQTKNKRNIKQQENIIKKIISELQKKQKNQILIK